MINASGQNGIGATSKSDNYLAFACASGGGGGGIVYLMRGSDSGNFPTINVQGGNGGSWYISVSNGSRSARATSSAGGVGSAIIGNILGDTFYPSV